jgi:tight adherence protein B
VICKSEEESMGSIGILVAALIGLAIMTIFAGLFALLNRETIADRMHEIVQTDVVDRGGARFDSVGPHRNPLKQLDSRLLARGLGQGVTESLLQADLKLTATEYFFVVVGSTLLGGLLGFAISRQPVSAFVAGIIGFFVPGMLMAYRKGKRRREFDSQLVDALTQMSGSLRAGYSLGQSLDTVARQIPPPAGDEFGRVIRETQLGQPLSVALDHMVERIKSDDLLMVVASININRQIGGNLSEILETAAETIRERVRIKREIQVLTAQQRISGYVLTGLPIGLGAILLIINPTYQMRLFTPGPTLCIPVGAGLGILVGFLIMRRIVDIDV